MHATESSVRNEQILPTLFGQGSGLYGMRGSNFGASILAHAVALVLILTSGLWLAHPSSEVRPKATGLPVDVSVYEPIVPNPSALHGGGGGGDHDKMLAPQGHLPKAALDQLAPAEVIVRNTNPKLVVEPTVILPPQIAVSSKLPNLGDPKSSVVGPPSNGVGAGSGYGSGVGGGIGEGDGGGYGAGIGGSTGGGVYTPGVGGVSAPRAIFKPDPEYSTEARLAKYQGTVVLNLVVDASGTPRQVHVARSLGMGLDEKAVEAVRQWKFEPARKEGKPVAVSVSIQVAFRLF